jgi:NlpC/P60 family putative phage cell wall peptidase
MDKELLVSNAKTWIGTPCIHHQAVKQVGADCVGFLKAVCEESNGKLADFPNHAYYPVNDELTEYLDRFFIKIPIDKAESGDVYLFKFRGINAHVGIASKVGVIHACPFTKKVVEHRLDTLWKHRLIGAYTWP